MRAIWTGVVSFGLVSVPVRLYAATFNHDIRFHQVHDEDGGQIRYKRVCEVCGKEVVYADIAKGYRTEDGELVTLDADDLASLPLSSSREIEVVEFVPSEQVDPLLLDRSYYLEPDAKAIKPYALLREALRAADQMAVVKVAIRQRETLALLRVRDRAIVLQTMLWPDEVREPDFDALSEDVVLRPQETQMAQLLVSSLGAEFDPTRFDDRYKSAVEDLIEFKREHGGARPAPVAAAAEGEPITDLLSALKRSVEEARAGRGGSGSAPPDPGTADPAADPTASGATPGSTAESATGAAAKKPGRSGSRKKDGDGTPDVPAPRKPGARKPAAKAEPKSEKKKTPSKRGA